MCALSIGWNPVYDNAEKTIEVYIMHDFGGPENEFYGQ
jgi:FAD synthase